jgi:hypothetical protein
MTVSMGTLVQSWSRPTLLAVLGLLSMMHVLVFFFATVFSPTLFHARYKSKFLSAINHKIEKV